MIFSKNKAVCINIIVLIALILHAPTTWAANTSSFAIFTAKESKTNTPSPFQDLNPSLLSNGKGLYIHVAIDQHQDLAIQLANKQYLKWDEFMHQVLLLEENGTLRTTPVIINTTAINDSLLIHHLRKIKNADAFSKKGKETNAIENDKITFILETNKDTIPCQWIQSSHRLITKTANSKTYNNQASFLWIDTPIHINDKNDKLTLLFPIMKEWRKYGKFPLFISTNDPNLDYSTTHQAIKTTNTIQGHIITSDTILNTIFWSEDSQVTSCHFNFPFDSDIRLQPSAPGYSFSPSVINARNNNDVVTFTANKAPLYSDLKAYYNFENNRLDATHRSKIKNSFGTTLAEDKEKGNVLNMKRGDFLELPPVKYFNFKDNSFTIAIWVKYTKDEVNNYSPIICSDQASYRKGLQVAIRDGHAYAGFWHADIYGEAKIPEKTWTHIVSRYDHVAQRMTIFVNGKEDVNIAPYYSFIGDGKLFVGRIPAHTYGFEGQLDDIMIWDRTISDNDIHTIYSRTQHDVPTSKRKEIIIGSILLLIAYLSFIVLRYRSRKRKTITNATTVKNDYKYKIFLLGDFQIINKDGTDIGQSLSPRLKSMFILILIATVREGGITPSQLRKELWEEFPKKKGQNAQRVTLSRLKNALKDIEDIKLNTNEERWTIDINYQRVWVDFNSLCRIRMNNPEEHVHELLQLLKRGAFIQEFQEPWADKQKSIFSNRYYDFLISVLENTEIDSGLRKNMADIVMINEPLNETALKVQVQYYIEKGRRNMAKQTYDSFCKQYIHFYGEEFKTTFVDLIPKH